MKKVFSFLLSSFVCIAFVLVFSAIPAAAYVYYHPNTNTYLGRASLDGAVNDPNFIYIPSGGRGLTVDKQYIYWGNGTNINSDGSIGRASIDGTNINPNFIEDAGGVVSVATDSNYIYWVNYYDASIGRARLDGTDVNTHFINTVLAPVAGLSVDAQHIYWTNYFGNISRADIDGNNVNNNFVTPTTSSIGIAVDSNYIYWTNTDNNIGRVSLSGSNVDNNFINNVGSIVYSGGVTVDNQYIYWDNGFKIGQARIDGSQKNNDFLSLNSQSFGVAVDSLTTPIIPAPIPTSPPSTKPPTLSVTDFWRKLARDYQPALILSKSDPFWPISFNHVMEFRGNGHYTCALRDKHNGGNKCGVKEPLNINVLHPNKCTKDKCKLDYPAADVSIDAQKKEMYQALGVSGVNQDAINKTARIYYYPGGGRTKDGKLPSTAYSMQYWFFYPFNFVPREMINLANLCTFHEWSCRGYHEGDWEGVSIVFGNDNSPKYVIFNQHDNKQKIPWNSSKLTKYDGGARFHNDSRSHHLVVGIAKGSHATYSNCGLMDRAYPRPPDIVNCSSYNGIDSDSNLARLSENSWACWGGRIGESTGSPPPIYQFEDSPLSPLWQQNFYNRRPNKEVCPRMTRKVTSNYLARDDEVDPDLLEQNSDIDPLADVDTCDDWLNSEQLSTTGTYMVVCDPQELKSFTDSELSAPNINTVSFSGETKNDYPPVTWWSDKTISQNITPSFTSTSNNSLDVYVDSQNNFGQSMEARFNNVPLKADMPASLNTSSTQWKILDMHGNILATAVPSSFSEEKQNSTFSKIKITQNKISFKFQMNKFLKKQARKGRFLIMGVYKKQEKQIGTILFNKRKERFSKKLKIRSHEFSSLRIVFTNTNKNLFDATSEKVFIKR